ncbi:G-protein coupled receptor 54-like [Branchiostoma floridae]|uniref:G-protein coupled receptor 54-like n=1 Tax=Branchiostoma floridae TaxID=7739 RepID=A0A9J7N3B3_BRAFL|nr:G-protein coupled receptor 54-like [Branchiostoma floridae]
MPVGIVDRLVNFTGNSTSLLDIPTTIEAYVAPTLYSVIFLVGVTGNSLVIYIVARFSEMRTVTNYYIVNLAVTDLAFLVCCVPFTAANYTLPSWIFGEALCKLVNYLKQVAAQATCLTLAVLSVDRYCAIVHPLASLKYRRTRIALVASVCTWAASVILAIPVAIYYRLVNFNFHGMRTYCRPVWPSVAWEQGYMIYTVLVTYAIPMTVCSSACFCIVRQLWNRFKERENGPLSSIMQTRRVISMVVGVVILFGICWLPNHVLNLWRTIYIRNKIPASVYWAKMFALFLSYANSAINPFVYTLLGENYRKCLRKTGCCRHGNQQKRDGTNTPKTHRRIGPGRSDYNIPAIKITLATDADRFEPDKQEEYATEV